MYYVNQTFSIVFFSIFSLFLIILFQMKYKWNHQELIKNIICMTMLIGLLTITLFPVPIGDEKGYFYRASNFIPFHSIQGYIMDAFHGMYQGIIIQLLGNIGMFVIIEIILSWFLNVCSWKKAILIGLILSLSIEILQGILGAMVGTFYRSVDIDDVILNVLGSTIGYFFYNKWCKKE